jgi:hypothetical protein
VATGRPARPAPGRRESQRIKGANGHFFLCGAFLARAARAAGLYAGGRRFETPRRFPQKNFQKKNCKKNSKIKIQKKKKKKE